MDGHIDVQSIFCGKEESKDSSPWPADSPNSRSQRRESRNGGPASERASEGVKGDEIAKREPLRGEREREREQ